MLRMPPALVHCAVVSVFIGATNLAPVLGSIWNLNPRAFEGLIMHHVNGINKNRFIWIYDVNRTKKGHPIITSHHNWSRTRGVSHKYCNKLYNYNLTLRWQRIVIYSYNKTKSDALISQIYFYNITLHAPDSSSVHHQEFFTVHTAMVFVIADI